MKAQEAIEKLREFCKLRAFCELYPDACQKDKCEIYMAIEALSEPSRQGQQNGLISHRDAIEAIDEITWYHQNANKDMVSGANSNEHQAWYKAEDVYKALESVPSTQPEQPTEVQDILRYLDEYLHPIVSPEHWSVYSELHDMVSKLQSAQPERKTGEWVGAVEYCKHLEETTGERYQPSGLAGMLYCNQCWTASDRKSNYCRSCGADMRPTERNSYV